MAGHFFISYSRLDGLDFAIKLADDLGAGPEGYRVWLDQREMRRSRQDWDDQLTEAIQTCEALLFLMTKDSVRAGSGCKDEWVWALKYKKPVIPLLFDAEADLPFRLGSRQFVDFSTDGQRGLAQLRSDLRWMGTPDGRLHELQVRLEEAERELPRNPAQQPRIEREIEQLREDIQDQQRLVDDPQAVAELTDARIAAGIGRERQPERPVPRPSHAKFVNNPPLTAPSYFQDRHVETGLIADFLRTDGLRMMSVVGRGGVGKTAMVCRLLKALEVGQLPDDLGELAVDGIVYLSAFGAQPLGFDRLFADLCRLLAPDVAEALDRRSRDPHETPAALMRALLERFATGRWVLLLDNFEDVVDADGVGLRDSALEESLETILRAPEHGLKVIITTRLAPRNLLLVQPGVQRKIDLDEGLPSPFAEEVLRAMDPNGALGIKDAPDELLAQVRVRTRGFPRALEALVAILSADRDTTLPELLADTERMPANVVEALVGEAFNRLDDLSQQVMQALAIYPGPAPPVAVDYLLQPFQPAIDSAPVLGRLVNMQFVRRDAGRYYLHQVDRDYAAGHIPVGEPTDRFADPLPFTRYALRERAATYYQTTRTPRETWRTLDDLAPQLAEFELRCQARDYDTAATVLVEISSDYLQLWGHIRLARDLHERVAGQLTDPLTNAYNLLHLGNAYWALGETQRAIDLTDEALTIAQEIRDRSLEVGALALLGRSYQWLGELRHAIDLNERALSIARELGDRYGEADVLTMLGSSHRQLGDLRRAIDYYEQALTIHQEVGDRQGEDVDLGNLGEAYARLGEQRRAIEHHERALEIFEQVGYRYGESCALASLAEAQSDARAFSKAIESATKAVAIADEIGSAQVSSEGRVALATAYLRSGAFDKALATAHAARDYDYAPSGDNIGLIIGIASVRQGRVEAAREAFREAVNATGMLPPGSGYDELYSRALAFSGLAVVDDAGRTIEAIAAFRAARAATCAEGLVARVLDLLDVLASGDAARTLAPVRSVAAGGT